MGRGSKYARLSAQVLVTFDGANHFHDARHPNAKSDVATSEPFNGLQLILVSRRFALQVHCIRSLIYAHCEWFKERRNCLTMPFSWRFLVVLGRWILLVVHFLNCRVSLFLPALQWWDISILSSSRITTKLTNSSVVLEWVVKNQTAKWIGGKRIRSHLLVNDSISGARIETCTPWLKGC